MILTKIYRRVHETSLETVFNPMLMRGDEEDASFYTPLQP